MTERYISLASGNAALSAILHTPTNTQCSQTGVLIIVGGPQYRVGSHRQFVKLSRYLADNGIASMRLDTSGMGDSSGSKAAFYQQDNDIETAITAFMHHNPQLKNLVLWGLCDAASAILIKLNKPDPRLAGVVLLNPWVRQQHSHAEVMLKHYYLKRLFSRQFWQKMFGGGVALRHSLKDIWQTLQQRKAKHSRTASTPEANEQNYVQLMLQGWQRYQGKTLLITSGNDLTAQEFLSLCQHDDSWRSLLSSAQHCHINDANHTFSTLLWRQQVEQLTFQFIQQLLAK
ncbi:MAG: hydrolase 1, exosortase A system-associated [Gammaproteobacteria bacterium]|nr:hydrolase 1, exosortase A system-associated [Gammaproteobacteria bacterium]MBU1556045.1 hydrolase 1, exosortase A system-associated [Gammaproteobacteria bacterium]MBU2069218.1 hydrolase 1, exosortase A system-associated [Gammaproteobacteria bacterium]MBU2182313.1 hydrolase 1, exosortase A system-associated [Gammaproteobacteria bacterium]MBU2204915.1 hydrolase 1, exosortase A system-associated [Gammaproteobacteria bacterium]